MAKRSRTNHRLLDLRELAERSHAEGWTPERRQREFTRWQMGNPDLRDPTGIATARSEFNLLANPRLAGALPSLWGIVESKLAREPAGSRLRFHHELMTLCRQVLRHDDSVATAIRELMPPHRMTRTG